MTEPGRNATTGAYPPWPIGRSETVAIPSTALRTAATVVAIVGLAVASLAGFTWWALDGGLYGCTPRDVGFSDVLVRESALDLPPPGAAASGAPYSGCDDDEGFAYAGQSYLSATSPRAVLDHYRTATADLGWTPDGARCFTREIDGVTAYLSVWFRPEAGERTPDFFIEIRAGRDEEAWC